jgi:hypothetical protein
MSLEERENAAPKLADTLHLLDCSSTNGVFNPKSEMPAGMNSDQQLLAQLAGDSAPHQGPRRSLGGLPMTEGGQPAKPHTYEEWDDIINRVMRNIRLEEA